MYDVTSILYFKFDVPNNTIGYIPGIKICIVSGSSKIQTLLPSNVIEISPQGFKFCNSVEKYLILLDGNNIWILLEPLTINCVNYY